MVYKCFCTSTLTSISLWSYFKVTGEYVFLFVVTHTIHYGIKGKTRCFLQQPSILWFDFDLLKLHFSFDFISKYCSICRKRGHFLLEVCFRFVTVMGLSLPGAQPQLQTCSLLILQYCFSFCSSEEESARHHAWKVTSDDRKQVVRRRQNWCTDWNKAFCLFSHENIETAISCWTNLSPVSTLLGHCLSLCPKALQINLAMVSFPVKLWSASFQSLFLVVVFPHILKQKLLFALFSGCWPVVLNPQGNGCVITRHDSVQSVSVT